MNYLTPEKSLSFSSNHYLKSRKQGSKLNDTDK